MSRVQRLVETATDVRLTDTERENATRLLGQMAKGGEGEQSDAAREAVGGRKSAVQTTEGLEEKLLRETGARSLREVDYVAIQPYCAARRWSPEAWALYEKWIGSAADRVGVVLKAYLALHFGDRATATHLISNAGKPWPYHNCNAASVKTLLDAGLACKDAETICREFLETGHVKELPEECECWRLTKAIQRAHREKDARVLIDELAQSKLDPDFLQPRIEFRPRRIDRG